MRSQFRPLNPFNQPRPYVERRFGSQSGFQDRSFQRREPHQNARPNQWGKKELRQERERLKQERERLEQEREAEEGKGHRQTE